jgi:hypothetical protein
MPDPLSTEKIAVSCRSKSIGQAFDETLSDLPLVEAIAAIKEK